MSITEAQKRATMKYMKEKLYEIRFRVKIEEAEHIKQRALEKGMSLRAYVLDLIRRDMSDALCDIVQDKPPPKP